MVAASALKAADLLAAEGIRATVVNMHTVKPLDEDAVLYLWLQSAGAVVTAEEHSVIGGLGSAVAEVLAGRSGAKFARDGHARTGSASPARPRSCLQTTA